MKTFVEEFIEQLARSAGAIDIVTKFLAARGIREKGSGFGVDSEGRRWETTVVFFNGIYCLHGELVLRSHATRDGIKFQHPHVLNYSLRLTKNGEPTGERLDLYLNGNCRSIVPFVSLQNKEKAASWIAPFADIEHRLSVGLIAPEKASAEVLENIATLLAE